MTYRSFCLIVISTFALQGCTTNDRVEAVGRSLKANPTERVARIDYCVARNPMIGHDGWAFARELKMKPGPEAIRTICTRMVDGIISGRITSEDFDRLHATRTPSPRMMQVLLGR